MEDKLVTIYESEPRTGTALIALAFRRKHKYVLELVGKYESDFREFGRLKRRKVFTEKRGRPSDEYLLNEDQFSLLATYFKNTPVARALKKKIIHAFSECRRQLAAVKSQHTDQKWIMSRDFGKEQRLEATDSIKEFVAYAKGQGSKSADWYFASITRMMNGLLFISGGKFKSLRNVLTAKQLMIVASAESIISKGLKDGMKANTFYKDIYKSIKKNTLDFAGLTGQTQVIEDQLKLEE